MDWTDNQAASRGLHSKTSVQPYSVQRIAVARDPDNLPFWFDGKFSLYLDLFAVSAVRRLLAVCKTGSVTVRLEKHFQIYARMSIVTTMKKAQTWNFSILTSQS